MEWILAVGGFALGIVGGIFLGQSSGGSSKINKQVEEELQAVQDELNGYRNEVTMHFSKTADLFNTVTSDYHKLYQHLADGAQQFSQTDALLPDAVTKLTPLAAPVESGQTEEASPESTTEQVAAASAGESDSATETATASDATSTDKAEEAGQPEGEAAVSEQAAEATASGEAVEQQAGEAQAKVSETEDAKTTGDSETAKADSETDAGQSAAAESSETQAGSQEEVPAKASGEEEGKSAAPQPGSDTDTFTVPASEKEDEKRLH